MRAMPGYIDRRRSREPVSSPGKWITPVTLTESKVGGDQSTFSRRATAHELIEQRRALELWLQGAAAEEIAQEIGGSPEQATKMVRAVLERLRRKFRDDDRGD
jgi:hypothetical protein